MKPINSNNTSFDIEKIVDILIQLGILYLLISWSFEIIKPFGLAMIWGAIIAITVYPAYCGLLKLFRGRKALSSIIIALAMFSVLVIPGWYLTGSIITEISHLRESYNHGQPLIPPPGETVKNWPSFTKPVIDLWQLASNNLEEAALRYKNELTEFGSWLFSALGNLGSGVVQFLISILLSAVFLVFSETLTKSFLKIFKKIAPAYGDNFLTIIVNTLRSIVKGVIGVAAIQAAMAGIGLYLVGIPYSGLWTILCLILSILQVGSLPVLIPISIYLFTTNDFLTAILFTVWAIAVVFIDNILTPIFLGRGAIVPMPVIFIGSLGGFVAFGFLGLFFGAVILSISYKLFESWLNNEAIG